MPHYSIIPKEFATTASDLKRIKGRAIKFNQTMTRRTPAGKRGIKSI